MPDEEKKKAGYHTITEEAYRAQALDRLRGAENEKVRRELDLVAPGPGANEEQLKDELAQLEKQVKGLAKEAGLS